MNDQGPVYFVWRETQKGPPKCELWFGERSENGKPVPHLVRYMLTDEEAWKVLHDAMTFAELVALYPAPATQ